MIMQIWSSVKQTKKLLNIPRLMKRRGQKAGLPPGTLVYTGEERKDAARITVIDYDTSHLQEQEVQSVEECFPFKETSTVTWINIDGVHDAEIIGALGKHFGVHPLVLEDMMSSGQRPKMEDYDEYIFVTLRMIYYDKDKGILFNEQISLIVGENFVISIQEQRGDVFDPVRERIRTGRGRLRRMGADYLAYALVDVIVDNYFIVMENFGQEIESLEEEVVNDPTTETLQRIHYLKREMVFLRKAIWPLREVISQLQRGESPLVKETTQLYLRDVYDHTIEVVETIEILRDTATGMLDIYLSTISHKMNEVMKVLTIMATIFIPLTFIAGIYGMNFDYMPELKTHWGYPIVVGSMFVIASVMLVYFRRKRWL